MIAAIPRHLLVPRWWSRSGAGPGFGSDVWKLNDGPADDDSWLRAAYGDRSLVTRGGPRHADHGRPGDRPAGMPMSSATLPALIVQMLRHAHVYDGADVLDVGTGSGYGCAVLAHRLGSRHVTSVDVDAYLTEVAAERLTGMGLRPRLITGDATGPLPGTYDRIVSTVSCPQWRCGRSRRAGLPRCGHIEHHYQQDGDGRRTAWMLHPDGSWARSTSTDGDAPTVHQSGPRRLWDILDDIRHSWLRDGSLPVYGATVTITPDGVCHLKRGRWRATAI